MEEIRSCRDCANFEDRRDIDKVAMCALHSGPHVCCEEFNPRDERKNPYNVYNRFCSECANFEDIHGIPVCARIHSPGIACGGFRSKLLESSTIQQDNLMKTALLEYMIKENNPESIPASLLKIAKKWSDSNIQIFCPVSFDPDTLGTRCQTSENCPGS